MGPKDPDSGRRDGRHFFLYSGFLLQPVLDVAALDLADPIDMHRRGRGFLGRVCCIPDWKGDPEDGSYGEPSFRGRKQS